MSDLKTKVFVKGDKTSEVTTVNLLFQNGKKFSIPIVHCIYVEMDDGMHIISGWSHDIFASPGASR